MKITRLYIRILLEISFGVIIMLPFFIIVLILAGSLAGQFFFGNRSRQEVGKHSAKRKA